ncbi:MAG: hypothetical protein ACR2Q3_07370, partial [Woeseiaceae bacterium]
MAQKFLQSGGSRRRRTRNVFRCASSILAVALLLFNGSSRAQSSETEVHDCGSALNALRLQITTGQAIPRTLSSQCVDGVLQAEFRLLADIGQIDVRLLAEIVTDKYRFFGLAEFYGSASVNVLDENRSLEPPMNERALTDGSWVTITGRYNLL